MRDCFQRHTAPTGHGKAQDGTGAQQRRLEKLPVLHPQIALEGRQRPGAQHGHGDAVQLQGLGLVGVGGIGPLLARVFESLLLVGLGPVGAQGAQQQAGQYPLAGARGGQGADDGQQRIGAGIQQVVVPEGAQGHVLRPSRAEGQAPGLLAHVDEDGVVVHGHLPDAGLGVVGGELAPHHLVVVAAGQQVHAVGVPGQLQGKGFGDGDGLEQVLHAQEGALAGPGRRHRQQHRGTLVTAIAEQDFLEVGIHIGCPPFVVVLSNHGPVHGSWPPRDDLGNNRRNMVASYPSVCDRMFGNQVWRRGGRRIMP